MYTIELSDKAFKQLKIVAKNAKLLQRLQEIFSDIKLNPTSPLFKFEGLKHDKSGLMSKRLTQKDRVIYYIIDQKIRINEVSIISILDHY